MKEQYRRVQCHISCKPRPGWGTGCDKTDECHTIHLAPVSIDVSWRRKDEKTKGRLLALDRLCGLHHGRVWSSCDSAYSPVHESTRTSGISAIFREPPRHRQIDRGRRSARAPARQT